MDNLKLQPQINLFDYIGNSTGSAFSPHNNGVWSASFKPPKRITSWDGNAVFNEFEDSTGYAQLSGHLNGLGVDFTAQDRTIEFWMNSDAVTYNTSGKQYVFSYGSKFEIYINYINDFGIWKLELGIEYGGSLVCKGAIPLDEQVKPGKWIHVAITYQTLPETFSTTPNLFWRINVNGKRVILTSHLNPDYNGFAPIVKFGTGGLNDVANRFSGLLCNFLIYPFVKYTNMSFIVDEAVNSLPSIAGASDAFFRGPILRHEFPRTTAIEINTPSRSLSAGFVDSLNSYKSFTPLVVNSSPFKKRQLGVPTEYIRGTTQGSVYFDGNDSGIKLKNNLNSTALGSNTNWTFGSWVYPEMHYDSFGLLDLSKKYTLLSISTPGANQSAEIAQGTHIYLQYNATTARFDLHVVLKGDNNPSSMKVHLTYDTKTGLSNQWSSFRLISENGFLYSIWNGVTVGTFNLNSVAVTNGNWVAGEQNIGTRKYLASYVDTFKGYVGHCFYTSGSFFQSDEQLISSLVAGTGVLNYNYQSHSLFSCLTGLKDDYGTGSFCLSSTDLSVYDIARKNTVRSIGSVYSSKDITASSLSAYPSYYFNKTGYASITPTDYDFDLNLNHDSFTLESWINISSLSSSNVNYDSAKGQGIFQIGKKSTLDTFNSSVTSINDTFVNYGIGMSLSVAGNDSNNSLVLRTLKSDNTVEERTINYRRQRDYYNLPSGSSPVLPSCLQTNRWHHIALTYTPKSYNELNSTNISGFFDLFVDGVKQNDANDLPVSIDTIIKGSHLLIGGHCNDLQQFFGNAEEFKYIKGVVKYKENAFIPTAAQTSSTPVARIDVDNQTINTSTGAYLIVDNSKVNSFTLNLNGVNGVTFVDYFDSTNINNCKLVISTTNSVYSSASEVKVGNSVVLSSNKDELFTFYYFNTGSLVLGVSPTNIPLGSIISAPPVYSRFSYDKYEIINQPNWSPSDWFFTNCLVPDPIPQYDLTSLPIGSRTFVGSSVGSNLSAWNSPISYYKISSGSNGDNLKNITFKVVVSVPASDANDQADQGFLPVSYHFVKVQKNTGEVKSLQINGRQEYGGVFLFDVRKQKHLSALKESLVYGVAGYVPYSSYRILEFEGSSTQTTTIDLNGSFTCDGEWEVYAIVERPFIDSNYNFSIESVNVSNAAKVGSELYNNFQKTPLVSSSIHGNGWGCNYSKCGFALSHYGKSIHTTHVGSDIKVISINNPSMISSFESQFRINNDIIDSNSWFNSLYNLDYVNRRENRLGWWHNWNVFYWSYFWYWSYLPFYSGNRSFERPAVGSCDLTSIPQIEDFYIANEQLSSLNITGCNNLKNLICTGNKLSSLALNDKLNLEYLRCGNNPDLSVNLNVNMNKLHTLYASKTKLNSLDLTSSTKFPSLSFIRLVDNNISSSNVDSILAECNSRGFRDGEIILNGLNGVPSSSGISAKNSLIAKGWLVKTSNTGLPNTSTMIAGLTSIPSLYAVPDDGSTTFAFNLIGTQNVEVNLQNEENLLGLYFSNLPVQSSVHLNLSGAIELQNLNCIKSSLSSIELGSNKTLTDLNCSSNNLKSLSALYWNSLEFLDCSRNQIVSLNTSSMVNLKSLNCSNNKISSLEITGKTKLNELDVSNNNLSTLTLSNNVNLRTLVASNNFIENITIVNCFNLKTVHLRNCYLTTSEIDNLLNLFVMYGLHEGRIDLSGTNDIPSSSGIVSIQTLESRGWQCIYNSVAPVTIGDAIGNAISSAQDLTIGTSISSTIDYPGDSDWFKASGLVIGNVYTVYVDGITLRKPFLTVRSSSGTFKEHADNIVGLNPRKTFIADEAVMFFDVKGSNGKVGNYSIIVEDNVPITPVPTITTTFSSISAAENHYCMSVALSVENMERKPYSNYGGNNSLHFACYRPENKFGFFERALRLSYGGYPEEWGVTNSSTIKLLSPVYVNQLTTWNISMVGCVSTPTGYYWFYTGSFEGDIIYSIDMHSDATDDLLCPFSIQWYKQTWTQSPAVGGSTPGITQTYVPTLSFKVHDYIITDEYTATVSTTGSATMNALVSGTINFPQDRDWIKVSLSKNVSYLAGVCDSGNDGGWWARGDLNLGLRNSSGQEIAYSEDQLFFNDVQTERNPVISFTVPADGDYYLDIGAISTQAGISYNAMITNVPITFDVICNRNSWRDGEGIYARFTTKNFNNPLVGIKDNNGKIEVSHKNELETLYIYDRSGSYSFNGYSNLKKLSLASWYFENSTFAINNCPLLTSLSIQRFNVANSSQLNIDNIKTQLIEFNCSSCENLNVNSLNIPAFTNLKSLDCHHTNVNGIINIGSLQLQQLTCSNASVQGINAIPASLEEFNAQYNPLQGSLNFTSCSGLKSVNTHETNITGLSINGLLNLEYVNCSHSKLSSLNLSGLFSLTNLNASHNQINGSLNFANLTDLESANLESNLINNILNVNNAAKIRHLNVKNNNLSSLVFTSAINNLTQLNCSNNTLNTLTFTDAQSSISTLNCSNNNLTSIDTLKLRNLFSLDCQGNSGISTLDLTNCSNLNFVNAAYCTNLNSLTLPSNPNIRHLDFRGTSVNIDTVLNYAVTGENKFGILRISNPSGGLNAGQSSQVSLLRSRRWLVQVV